MVKIPKRFIKEKGKKMVEGLKFIRENFPTGARSIGQSIKQRLTGNVNFDNPDATELKIRTENLRKIKAASQKYLESHPGFKVPREMR